ncbi:MAG TPA: hypothetical protein VMB79_00135 [Jatrophihabitans sp.]|nr:hypothetical protein [Jatrophihabitans sp.]
MAALTGIAILASFGMAVIGTSEASATGSCSGTITYDHTYNVNGNPVAEMTIYYNTNNGGTNSACFYHRGAYYGKSEYTSVRIYRCSQHTASPGSACTIAASSAPDSGNYAYYAGPVGVTGTANYCVAAVGHMDLTGGGSIDVGTGARGC